MLDDVRGFFSPEETKCKCGCGMDIAPALLDKLNDLRAALNFPLVVVSGARCQKHNRTVGGSPLSLHLEGLACDIKWPADPAARLSLVVMAMELGFTGFGFYPSFVHIDLRGTRFLSPSLWVQ